MAPTQAGFKDLGFDAWHPPGQFDSTQAVWYTDRDVTNSFPESGVEVFDQVAESSFWFAHRNRVIHELIQRHGLSGAFLDVGSGTGIVSEYLASHGMAVGSVEPIASGAVRAAKRGVKASFCGDLASLKLPESSVPAIGMFDVIEHIEDPGDLLAEANRILTAEGSLVLTVPAHQWLWSDFDEWNGHYRRYDRSGLAQALESAGFEVVENSYFFLPLLVPAALTRVVFSRFRARRTKADIEQDLAEDLAPTNSVIDQILRLIHRPEVAVLGKRSLPTGTSIVALAKKQGQP